MEAQTKIGDLYYYLDETDKMAMIMRGKDNAGNYIKYSGDIVMPASVTYNGTTYVVVAIDESAFSCCTGLTSIEMPGYVSFIGDSAFAYCTGLTAIEIPSYVTSIGDYAFCGCTGLTAIEIPGYVTSIGSSAFGGCTGLTEVTIPKSVTSIGTDAFSGCTGLTAINVDESNTTYSSVGCVLYNKAKTSLLQYPGDKMGVVNIPSTVTSIGSSAFSGCTGLTSVTIPNSVTEIGIGAFSGCTGLTAIDVDESNGVFCSVDGVLYDKDKIVLLQYPGGKTGVVNIPSSVMFIGDYAFSGCTGLTSVTIPNSVTSIGDRAFSGCTGLASVTIADRETELYFSALRGNCNVFVSCPIRALYLGGDMNSGSSSPFRGMTTLETLTIGGSVTEIGRNAFFGCTSLMVIHVDEANKTYCSVEDILYNKDTTFLLLYPAAKQGLTSFEIPSSVTRIGEAAFADCSGLTSFETGDAVEEIGDYAFQNCGGLLTLTFGKSVSQIGRGIVDDCDKLRRLICTSEEPAACHTNAFQDIHKIRCDLIVPETALEAYKNALVWGDFLRMAGGDGSDKVYVARLSLTSSVTPAKLKVGEGMLLSAVIAPSNATNQTLTWSSSDKNVLRVDYDGYVIAVGAGEAVVTARTTDGSNLSATCTVTVTAAGSGDDGPGGGDEGDDDKILVETLEISTGGASTELQAGGTLQLSAVITPSNATNKAVTWSSSDKKVALVDNDGYVMAVAIGEAVITARTTDGSDLSATCTLTVTAAGSGDDGPGGGNTAVEVPDALNAVRVYAADGCIEVRGLLLGTAVTLSGVDGRLWYQTEAVTDSELTLSAPRGHVYVLRLNHTHSLKVYLP